jgi:hypothetical protein
MPHDFTLPDDLIGTWWFTHEGPDSPGLLILDASGRAVQFYTTERRLPKGQVMRLWYSVEDTCTLRFKGAPDAKGWVRTVSRTAEGFSILAEEKVFPLHQVDDPELPEWIKEEYDTEIHRMIEQEQL